MYNIQKAVSRLDFAPKLSDIKITDIKGGIGVFTPKPDRPVSYAGLKAALKRAGYTLASSEIVVSGKLARGEMGGWWLVTDLAAQRFALEGANLERLLDGAAPGARLEITGDWKTTGAGTGARETIAPSAIRDISNAAADGGASSRAAPLPVGAGLPASALGNPAMSFAPIRTTSPGLTVYRGGAVIRGLSFIRLRLGRLDVSRQVLQVSASPASLNRMSSS